MVKYIETIEFISEVTSKQRKILKNISYEMPVTTSYIKYLYYSVNWFYIQLSIQYTQYMFMSDAFNFSYHYFLSCMKILGIDFQSKIYPEIVSFICANDPFASE